MQSIDPNPDWKADPKSKTKTADEAQYAAIKAKGKIEVAFVTAQENVRNSKGMYRMTVEAPTPVSLPTFSLEDRSTEDLKVMYFSIGGKADRASRSHGPI